MRENINTGFGGMFLYKEKPFDLMTITELDTTMSACGFKNELINEMKHNESYRCDVIRQTKPDLFKAREEIKKQINALEVAIQLL